MCNTPPSTPVPDHLGTSVFTVVGPIPCRQTPARDETFRDDSTGHSSDSNVGRPNTSPMDDTLVAPGAEAAIATTTEHVNDAASSMGIVDESVGSPLGHTAGRQPEEASCLIMKGSVTRALPSNCSPAGDDLL